MPGGLDGEQLECAAAMLEPYFERVREQYASFQPDPAVEPELRLTRVRKTKLVVDPAVHDSARHYAACRDDGLLIVIAPEAADELAVPELYAIIAHELGHAVDYLYPARWMGRRGEEALWLPAEPPKATRLRRLWSERSDDQVEWSADSIAYAVVGEPITYGGPCMVQRFGGGVHRPAGLR